MIPNHDAAAQMAQSLAEFSAAFASQGSGSSQAVHEQYPEADPLTMHKLESLMGGCEFDTASSSKCDEKSSEDMEFPPMTEEEKLRHAVDMFRQRLLRKAYRPVAGPYTADSPPLSGEVRQCESDFIDIVRSTLTGGPVECVQWSKQCAMFSDQWPHVSHWLHPGRLAYFLSTTLNVKFTGRLMVSQPKERLTVRAKKYRCVECDVVCNSLRQYTVHEKGRKHQENLRIVQMTAHRKGGVYISRSPLPLNGDTAPDVYYAPLNPEYSEHKNGSTASASGSAQRARLEALAGEAMQGHPDALSGDFAFESTRKTAESVDLSCSSSQATHPSQSTQEHDLLGLLESLLPPEFCADEY